MDVVARISVLEAQRISDLEALKLQATEYERRLSDLNHAHERASQIAHSYLTIDKYEAIRASEALALNLALQRVEEKLDVLNKWQSKATGIGTVLVLVAGFVGAAISKILGV